MVTSHVTNNSWQTHVHQSCASMRIPDTIRLPMISTLVVITIRRRCVASVMISPNSRSRSRLSSDSSRFALSAFDSSLTACSNLRDLKRSCLMGRSRDQSWSCSTSQAKHTCDTVGRLVVSPHWPLALLEQTDLSYRSR